MAARKSLDSNRNAPPNNQMQKSGARFACHASEPLPASDLERWTKPLRGRFKELSIGNYHGHVR